MISKTYRINFLSLIFPLFLLTFCLAQDEYQPYVGIIHVHSNPLQGQRVYSLEKIISSAKDKGVKIIVFSDTFLRRLEYRFPGFFKIIKVYFKEDSVVKYGIKKYLEDSKKIKEQCPNTIILVTNPIFVKLKT